ncbi:ribosomal RNA processing protein 36 homolog isoform X1 [Anopheles ziemanni]|uniref:ribosomal RNA processing protein 36 homolog isoform X2 n=1 Tax=Anopheles coustani TaxID=139045 RepID=UPI00265B66FF|nr:ribosomal RNA processing protein 36 homolog isoform X2 [Anopheles coustani]XP_058173000.1 ribosomal RNA processing protein 36 homolog isoform X1 [Anopheles ziemanni]
MDSTEDNSENENSSNAEQEESSSEEETYNDSEENEPKLAEAEFKEIPFEDLLQLQRRLGSRMYNEAIFGTSRERKVKGGSSNPAKKLKSGNKSSSSSESDDDSGPEEVTSKRKVPALGMAKNKHLTKEGPRDPRFDSKHGYFSGRQFRKNYSFINELRQKELKKLKNSLENATDPEEADKIKFVIQRTHNQIHEYKKQKALDEGRMLEKQQARQAIQEGKRPFYERKSTKQAKALVDQYDKLKETGKLAKHIDKRRKKVTGKDRKKLDFST